MNGYWIAYVVFGLLVFLSSVIASIKEVTNKEVIWVDERDNVMHLGVLVGFAWPVIAPFALVGIMMWLIKFLFEFVVILIFKLTHRNKHESN